MGPWILGKNFDLKVKNPDFDGPAFSVGRFLRAPGPSQKKFRTQNLFRWLPNVITKIYIPHDPLFTTFRVLTPKKYREGEQNPPPPQVLIRVKKT